MNEAKRMTKTAPEAQQITQAQHEPAERQARDNDPNGEPEIYRGQPTPSEAKQVSQAQDSSGERHANNTDSEGKSEMCEVVPSQTIECPIDHVERIQATTFPNPPRNPGGLIPCTLANVAYML